MVEPRPIRVLVIDDDPGTRANLRDILELDNYQVETAGSVAETLQCTGWPEYAAIILDRILPDGTADDLLPRLRQLAPEAGVLVVTGYSDLQGAVEALRQGAADYILKPIDAQALRASLIRLAERRRLAFEKERSEAAFRTLVEAAPCMITILRPDYTILYFSPHAEELSGYQSKEVLGKDYFQLFLPDASGKAIGVEIQQVLAGKPTRGFENPIRCRDGTRRWMVWNAERLNDYEGGPALLAVGQDITQLKDAQEQALRSERLAAIGQMMTGLAHESGNALARSQACLEMLAMEVEDRPEALDLVSRIQKAQDHLRQLYEEVRGYAAPIKLERESWELSAIWRQAWDNLALRRQGKEAFLHEDTGGLDLHCLVDHFRLDQVFRNILENSLAACPNPVRIDIACSETILDGVPAIQVAVRDNGPGLTPEQKQRIFEPFYTTKTKGTGLGMAIAKRIVEAHGGSIAVGSPPCEGSVGSPPREGGARGGGAEILITLPREAS